MKTKLTSILLALLALSSFASAISLNSIDAPEFSPGSQEQIRIEVENLFGEDVEEFSITLNFSNIPFIPVGSSEQSVEEIEEGDEETFVFTVKASQEIVAGDYEIPYTLRYKLANSNEVQTRSGSIGLTVSANPDLSYSLTTENPVIGRQGTLTLTIVNKGFYDARFVSVRALPERMTLLSEEEVYIGTIDSDDFETASFDVLFSDSNPEANFVIEYIDFNNQKLIEQTSPEINVYSESEAVELGIIEQSATLSIFLIVIALILLIIIWRYLRKRKRLKRSQRLER